MNAASLALWTFGPLIAAGVLGVMFDAFSSRRASLVVVLAGFGVSGAVSLTVMLQSRAAETAWRTLHVDGAFATVALTVAVLGALAVAGGWDELERREWGGSIAGLMAFGAAASMVVASSRDLTLLLIALEIAAACAYALVASGEGARAREAAIKYFIQSAIATGFFVFGMAVLVTVFLPTGDLDTLAGSLLASALPASVAAAALVLLVTSLALKAGAAPLHSWVPDAYESASPESAAFLTAGPKLGVVSALAILAASALSGRLELPLAAVLGLLAIASVLVGSIAALRQQSYTRMLGYAGIAQIGYALIGMTTAHVSSVPIFFTTCYALAATGTFLSAAAFRRVDPAWDGSVGGLAGMSRKAPLLSGATAVLVISLAGIPPLLGFWAKFVVFAGAIGAAATAFDGPGGHASGWLYAAVAIVGMAGSVISLGYYGAVLRSLYQSEPEMPSVTAGASRGRDDPLQTVAGNSAAAAVVVIASLTVVFGSLPLWSGISRILAYFG